MATIILDSGEYEKFKVILQNTEPDRYQLCYSDDLLALIPVVTSKNVHTYVIFVQKQEQTEEARAIFKGLQIKVKEILFDKW